MSEYEIAIMEAERNHAEDEYFKARPQIDTGHCRHLFRAGFGRAWQASRAQSGQGAEPFAWVTEDAVEKQKVSGRSRRLWWENNPGVGFPIYTHLQPSQQWEPSGIEYDRAIHHNPDAKAWADLFMQTFPYCGADPETMLGWFANAMMAMHDHLKNSQPAHQGVPEELTQCLGVQLQEGNWNFDPYMHGMANGLILAEAICAGTEPSYKSAPDHWISDATPQPEGDTTQIEYSKLEEWRDTIGSLLNDYGDCSGRHHVAGFEMWNQIQNRLVEAGKSGVYDGVLPGNYESRTPPVRQGSVPESIEVAIDMLVDYANALETGDLDGAGHSTTSCIYEVIAQLAASPQPPQEDSGDA